MIIAGNNFESPLLSVAAKGQRNNTPFPSQFRPVLAWYSFLSDCFPRPSTTDDGQNNISFLSSFVFNHRPTTSTTGYHLLFLMTITFFFPYNGDLQLILEINCWKMFIFSCWSFTVGFSHHRLRLLIFRSPLLTYGHHEFLSPLISRLLAKIVYWCLQCEISHMCVYVVYIYVYLHGICTWIYV